VCCQSWRWSPARFLAYKQINRQNQLINNQSLSSMVAVLMHWQSVNVRAFSLVTGHTNFSFNLSAYNNIISLCSTI
jgi:hypothetical protein